MFPDSSKQNKALLVNLDKSNTKFSISELPDSEIWNEFKEGNEGAFNHIYLTYFQDLYKYGQQFTTDLNLVQDLIQDLFIYIRKNRTTLGDTRSIKFYLFKAFRRDILRFFKRNKLIYSGRVESFCNFRLESSHEVRILQRQLDSQKKDALEHAFFKLTKRQKEAIYYHFYQSMSYQEVAMIMDLRNVKSARNLIYKSIDSMKAHVNPIKKYLFF